MVNHTQRDELVYDPFLGSGTTLAAAELTGRVCCGMELDPSYVDVIVERWQGLTGKQATLEGQGSTFQDVKSQRLPEPGGRVTESAKADGVNSARPASVPFEQSTVL